MKGQHDALSTRVPHQACGALSCREVSRGRVLNHVRGLWVRKKVLSRHQPPHTRPTRISNMDELVANDVLHRFRMNPICGNNEIGLQNLAVFSCDFAILGVLVLAC